MIKTKYLTILIFLILSQPKYSAQERDFSHEFFIAGGLTQPIRPGNNYVGLYNKKYELSFVSKANYTFRYKMLSLGVEGSYFKGYLIETENIEFDGNSSALSLTFPLSVYLYDNNTLRFSIYVAAGTSQFNTPAITRIKMLGGEPDNTTFEAEVENILIADFGTRFFYDFSNHFSFVCSLNYHIFVGLFQTQLTLPQMNIGIGYRI